MHNKSFSLLLALALAGSAHAHSLILSVTGPNGVTGTGIGVVASTPRNGRDLSDSTRIQGNTGCGRTQLGNNNVDQFVAAAVSSGLATAGTDGSVSMTLHQVNGDGAGPFTCEVSTDASGSSFVPMAVTTNVPGNNGNSGASAQNFPLVAQLPSGTACSGGANGNACLVRCRQPQGFGGCVAVTAAGGGGNVNGNAGNAGGNGNVANAANGNGNGGQNRNGNNGQNRNGNGNNGGGQNRNVNGNANTGNNNGGQNRNGNGRGNGNANTNGGQNRNNRIKLVRAPAPGASPAPEPEPIAPAQLDPIFARAKKSRIARAS